MPILTGRKECTPTLFPGDTLFPAYYIQAAKSAFVRSAKASSRLGAYSNIILYCAVFLPLVAMKKDFQEYVESYLDLSHGRVLKGTVHVCVHVHISVCICVCAKFNDHRVYFMVRE